MSIEFILITILSIFTLYVIFTYNQSKNKHIEKFNHNTIEEDNINAAIGYEESQCIKEPDTPVEIFKNSCDHSSNEQYARMCRAVSDDLMGEIISIDSEEMLMKIYSHGNPKDIYTVTLLKCECMDFKNRHLPCKHIYRLALELGVINLTEIENNKSVKINNSDMNINNEHNTQSNDDFEEEDTYEMLCDMSEDMYYKYEEYCEEVSWFFEQNFNISQRINKLENCINKLNNIKTKLYKYGKDGIMAYEFFHDIYENWEKFSKDTIIVNTSYENYRFEFEDIEFSNYNFLTYLLNLYKTDTKNQKEHLKQEKLFYEINLYGGPDKYQEHLDSEKNITLIKKKVTKLIKENDGILQSELINKFDEADKKIARKKIDELYNTNKISKKKSGSSYQLKYLDKTTNNGKK